jgi:hypothetical protein
MWDDTRMCAGDCIQEYVCVSLCVNFVFVVVSMCVRVYVCAHAQTCVH